MIGPFSGATLRKVKVRLEMDVMLPAPPAGSDEEAQLDRLDEAADVLGRAVRHAAVTYLVADVGEVKAEVDWAE